MFIIVIADIVPIAVGYHNIPEETPVRFFHAILGLII
jgi:hypothetical protein